MRLVDRKEEICGGGGCLFVLCSRPNIGTHLSWLSNLGVDNIIQYQLLLCLYPELSMNPYAYQYEKIEKQLEDIVKNWNFYCRILGSLADVQSKELMMKMLIFRLTYNTFMHQGNATKYSHYFDEDIISITDSEIFVDCGGYNGDTLSVFRNVTGDKFKTYYLFEPDSELLENARSKGDHRVIYVNKGIWSEETMLSFMKETADGNGSVAMDNNADDTIQIPVTTLDEAVETATFIKLDVEGAELHALKGAKKLIEKYHPKIAVCVYHKYEDYIELYKYIQKLGGYRIYLRAQYDNIDSELYYLCIPRDDRNSGEGESCEPGTKAE